MTRRRTAITGAVRRRYDHRVPDSEALGAENRSQIAAAACISTLYRCGVRSARFGWAPGPTPLQRRLVFQALMPGGVIHSGHYDVSLNDDANVIGIAMLEAGAACIRSVLTERDPA